MPAPIETHRLILRGWRQDDLQPFAAMCADPEVMADYPAPHTPAESEAKIARYQRAIDTLGFGRWAVEARADGRLLGYVGVMPMVQGVPLAAGFEIGWRLVRSAWGFGYASEAARASLADAFGRAGLAEVVAYAGLSNRRSEAVMRRLAMTRAPALDFEYPDAAAGRCIVYVARARADGAPTP